MDDSQPPSVIGDDGELTEADPDVDLSNYEPYEAPAWGETGEPTTPISPPWYERYPVGLVVVIGVFLVGMVVWINNNSAPSSTASTASNAGSLAGPFQLPASGASTISAKNRWENIQHVKWSSDSSDLGIVTAASRLFIWDFDQNQLITKESISGQAVDWQPNGVNFASGLHGQIDIRDGHTVSRLHAVISSAQWQILKALSILKFSPDGSQLIAVYDSSLWIVDANTSNIVLMKDFKSPIHDALWSPDSQRVYFTAGRTLYEWAGDEATSLSIPAANWVSADLSPDGSQLVVAYDSQFTNQPHATISLLNIKTGKSAQSIQIPTADTTTPMTVAWSPDGSRIAGYIEGESTITLWDSETLQGVGALYNRDNEPITSMDWSPDGYYLAYSSTSYVTIWNSLPQS